MNIEIKISKKPILYQAAIDFLEERAFDIHLNKGRELIWILEHQDIYTCGTSGKDVELLEKNFLPTIKTNRGGKWTYHGKGQKIVYFVLDLNKRGKEIKQLVRNVENWIIETLKVFKINSYNDPNNIGRIRAGIQNRPDARTSRTFTGRRTQETTAACASGKLGETGAGRGRESEGGD